MPRLERSGLVTAYAIEGAEPPVLLIHGVGARLDAWDGAVAALGGRFTTIRLDLRGHGESSKPPSPYSAALFAKDALALEILSGLRHAILIEAPTIVAGLLAGFFAGSPTGAKSLAPNPAQVARAHERVLTHHLVEHAFDDIESLLR